VLTEESWEGAELHDIVKGAVGAHDGGNRFTVTGPPLRLPPALSVSLSLVLHELATNATKYGALSVERGKVEIGWQVMDHGGEPRLTLRWVEHDGPPVKPPTRQGFGTRLIQRSFAAAGGTASLNYASHGLVCIIDAPIRRRSAPLQTARAS
jgi:two-component sensor histidine kinase